MAGMPLSINSTSASDPYASATGGVGSFTASPVYNKPWIDLENPAHLAVLAAAGLLIFLWLRKRR